MMSRAGMLMGVVAAQQTDTVTLTLEDPDRTSLLGKRKVTAKFCMPDSDGKFPLYIFGHGAGCAAQDYQYFCSVTATAMLYHGSVVDSIFPADFDTANAALDAAFLAKKLPELSASDPSSPVYGRLSGDVVIGGHSMGGGMTVLAVGKEGAAADGVVVFAPGLYTKPDATPFLANISVPTLIVSGSKDCGSNALDKQAQPTYDGLSSSDKVLVVLKGANHCQWIEPLEPALGVCKTFEANECHDIDRDEQHQAGQQLLQAFLGAVKSDQGWSDFEAKLAEGESKGTWSYVSSRTSDPSKKLSNECPCSAQFDV